MDNILDQLREYQNLNEDYVMELLSVRTLDPYATSRKVAGSSPDESLEIFN
jgi:hypothetical protein